MAMSEEEILREAARIRAERPRVAKTCARCGQSYLGNARSKYCSDACRMAAARDRRQQETTPISEPKTVYVPAQRPGESIREYWERTADGPLTEHEEELVAALERIQAIWDKLGNPVLEDSTELIRRMREERSKHLASL